MSQLANMNCCLDLFLGDFIFFCGTVSTLPPLSFSFIHSAMWSLLQIISKMYLTVWSILKGAQVSRKESQMTFPSEDRKHRDQKTQKPSSIFPALFLSTPCPCEIIHRLDLFILLCLHFSSAVYFPLLLPPPAPLLGAVPPTDFFVIIFR